MLYATVPNSRDRSIVIIEQGVITLATFDALNTIINNIAKLQYFSNYKLRPFREIAKEPKQTDYSFIYLGGGDLIPLNYKVFSAHRFFRHAGMDVRYFNFKYLKICTQINIS